MTRSVPQESVQRDQRGFLPGLSILNGRERNLTKLPCLLKEQAVAERKYPFRDGDFEPLEPSFHVAVALQCVCQLPPDHSASVDEVDRQIVAHKVEMVLVRRVFQNGVLHGLSSRNRRLLSLHVTRILS